MKKTAKSLGHSLSGLMHAIKSETNIQKFLIAEAIVFLIGAWAKVHFIELLVVLLFGGFFLVVELLNTAIERLADTFDDGAKRSQAGHYHLGVKLTKDVAAAASLVALLINIFIIVMLYLPYVLVKLYPA